MYYRYELTSTMGRLACFSLFLNLEQFWRNNKTIIEFGFRWIGRPSGSVDNTVPDLQNSSYPTQLHSIISNYFSLTSTLMRFQYPPSWHCFWLWLSNRKRTKIHLSIELSSVFASSINYGRKARSRKKMSAVSKRKFVSVDAAKGVSLWI